MRIKQSFMYWIKVVSLGVILGVGLQVAQAWVAPTAVPPNGNIGLRKFVSDCNQFAVNGWSDKQECLHDGRWHMVQNTMGTMNADLKAAIDDAAEIRIKHINASNAHSSKNCSSALYISGYALCLSGMNYAGSVLDNVPGSPYTQYDAFNGSTPVPDQVWGHLGAGIVRSDGHTRTVRLAPANAGNTTRSVVPYMMVSEGSMSSLSWYARY